MAEETLKIKVVVDNQASSAINNIKQQFNKTTQTTDETSKSIGEITGLLNNLRTANISSLGLQFVNLQRSCDSVRKSMKAIKQSVFDFRALKAKIWNQMDGLRIRINDDFKSNIGDPNWKPNAKDVSDYKQLNELFNNRWKLTRRLVSDMKEQITGIIAPLKGVINLVTKLFILSTMIKSAVKEIKSAIQVAANGDKIRDDAQKVFMSATAYQEWGYVLKQNGIEITALNEIMKQFARNAVKNTNILSEYAKETGTISEAFTNVIKKVQGIADPTEKFALANELIGENASKLMPILNSEAGTIENLMRTYRLIGGTMSDELIHKSDVLTDSITEMKAAWQGLKNTLATGLIPIITTIVQGLTLAIAKIRIIVRAIFGITETFGKLNDGAKGFTGNLDAAAGSAGKLKRILMGYDELNRLEGSDGSGGSLGIDTDSFEAFGDIFNNSEILDKLQEFEKKIERIKEILRLATPVLLTGSGLLLAVLSFAHGDILGGIAALGLAGMGITLGITNGAWEDIFRSITGEFEKHKAGLIGIASALVGLACLATGNLAVGIPLVALGLAAFAGDYSTVKWGDIFGSIFSTWNRHQVGIVGIASALVGLAAIATGNFLFGIPLLAAGGIMIGSDIYGSGQWGTFFSNIKRTWQEHNATFVGITSALVGMALLTRGLIIPGLVLMAAGGIVITADVNGNGWGVLFGIVKDVWNNNKATIAGIVSVFTGLWMLMRGWAIPGLALIAAGGIAMTVDQTIGWDTVFAEIKNSLDNKKAEIISWASVFAGFWMCTRGMIIPGIALMAAGGISLTVDNTWGWDNIFGSLHTACDNAFSKISTWVTKVNKKLAEVGVSYKSNINLSEHGNNGSAVIKFVPQATGGVWTTPTPALLAEYPNAKSNPEIVAPQSIIRETIDASNGELANAFAQGVRQIVSAIESKDDTVIIGDETIARAAGKGNASHIKRTGVSLI